MFTIAHTPTQAAHKPHFGMLGVTQLRNIEVWNSGHLWLKFDSAFSLTSDKLFHISVSDFPTF